MISKQENRLSPADIAPDERVRLRQAMRGEIRPVLISPNGDVSELPKVLNDVFLSLIEAMEHEQAVIVLNENEDMTTQAAADFLGISRQHLVRLLEAGKIPFHKAGTHRRVSVKDVAAYDEARSIARRAGLDRMTEELVKAGLYDRFVPLERTE